METNPQAETAAPAFDEARARALIDGLSHLEGAALPILHALQEAFGCIDARAAALVAAALDLSRAEVHGLIAFYPDFRFSPEPRRVVKLCRGEACQALGCEALVEGLAARGVVVDGAGAVAVESVYCLGNCALGPSALAGGEVVGRLTPEKLARLCAGESEAR